MSAAPRGLGKGLGALFPDEPPLRKSPRLSGASDLTGEAGVSRLPLSSISSNPDQPRKHFEPAALEDLAASIREQGLLQPILVRPLPGKNATEPRYEIVAGERRWRASQLAGLTEVPVLVRELTDQQTLALALIENLQREDLNALEEALGMQRLKTDFGLSQDEVAKQLGKSRSAVANCLRLLGLPMAAQEDLREGRISAGHARALLAFENQEDQEAARHRILEEGISVRVVEALAYESKAAATPLTDPSLISQAGITDESGAGQSATTGELGEQSGQVGDFGQNGPDQQLGQAGQAGSVRSGKPTGRAKPQSAILLDLQAKICSAVKLPVKISGRENKGRLNISYSSPEELQKLLRLLGV
ncbi:MAG: ParB/RepB/Spo0J family partition protein [Deltaproteobacteria bacterium]|jgi:ParB family chromosome partitioning protein|nr:ParB/RepB/Spo0J family partition protein [Deltaproteobacteria bacterium]